MTDHPRPPGVHVIDLADGWTVRPVDPAGAPVDAAWPVPAAVPGCVHLDLLAAGIIPDPHLDAEELAVRWVADLGWEYRTTVDVPADLLAHEEVVLAFDGLDTLATVVVGGQVVARTEDMHRRYRVDVRGALAEGPNDVVVRFASATLEVERRRREVGCWPAASFEGPFNMVRKMACAWGWDWGLALPTAGIWRPARLEGRTGGRLAAVLPTAGVDDDGVGDLRVVVGVEPTAGATPAGARVEVALDGPGLDRPVTAGAPVVDGRVVLDLRVPDVARWWPRSLGDQPLHDLVVTLVDADGRTVDVAERRIGFRTVELDQHVDDDGQAFALVVNGVRLFTRGVNWIPDDVLVAAVDRPRYAARLRDVVDLGADLVRVWGGGTYEADAFYDVCDELGLLVWQDFAFACAAYPEELLAAEVEAEARDNVTRLAHHPSLAVWCGGNETLWGFADWGWAEPLDGRAWGEGFYRRLLPAVVAELDPARPYVPGSPASADPAVHPNDDDHGTQHLWDVWNEVDHRHYRDHRPRFVSEFGWQAPPTWTTLRRSLSDDPLTPDSPGMAHHQKAVDGDVKLARGLEPFFAVPEAMADWMWAMQLNQARAVRTGVTHLRSLRDRCAGAIWWQHNDCWPVTSWAVLDGDGFRKPAWYALRDAFADRLLVLQPAGDGLEVVAVTDGTSPWAPAVTVRRIALDGTVRAEATHHLEAGVRSVARATLDPAVAVPADPAGEVVVADADGLRACWLHVPDRDAALLPVRPRLLSSSTAGDDLALQVRVDVVAVDACLVPAELADGLTCDAGIRTVLPGEVLDLTVAGGAAHDPLSVLTTLRTANDLVAGR